MHDIIILLLSDVVLTV